MEHQENSILLPKFNHHLSQLVSVDWFDIDTWKLKGAVTGQSKGRNITWFIGHQEGEWVLRHYYRGGLVAKLSKDEYFFTSLENTRCYAELVLLETMFQQGLPVPKPIAGRVTRSGFFYRNDILIEKIPNAQDLVARLQSEKLSEAGWHAIGSLIAKFHLAGIYHSDLNAHNILIDSEFKFWLIDFDKCCKKVPQKKWQLANLRRLKRSFEKESLIHEKFYFDDKSWRWLLQSYNQFAGTKFKL
ncbi:3-deoxy-D-manno-octulosonic acid kinase [Aliikangiella marina]|uniref:3-deoxy-D-manno-octulosonic acid kinase n=1 Tax=Aliikangiella marina TaxID=1712262 RepID=A0A545TJY5_9GAMM|nr:3-deoxy-D-manno-octulosonic acid kinase [Aliikangiella marina]